MERTDSISQWIYSFATMSGAAGFIFYGDRNCLQQAKDKSKNIAEKKTGYKRFQSYQCWLLTLLSMGVTELRVRGFNYFSEKEMS